jgi:hypothetical protein
MGWWGAVVQQGREMLSLPRPFELELAPAHTFDTAPRPIDQVIAGMFSGSAARVSRADALSVAAVKRGRNELCSIGTLPLRQYRGLDVVESPLLRQIDPDVANVVTMAATIEDLVFEGIAWWQVTGQDFSRYPVSARHVSFGRVSLRPPENADNTTPSGQPIKTGQWVWIDGQPYPASLMIRFDSPNPSFLKSRAVRRAILLDKLAAMYAENPRPLDYFTDADDPNVPEMDDDDVKAFLAEWQAARAAQATGWIPGTVKRVDVNAPSPAEIQLVQLQQQVTLELANELGLDPEDLGVSTTSRTYFNAQDRRTSKINDNRAPIMRAITDRLSMGDVTPRGYDVRFDLTDYLKSDPATQVTYWQGLVNMGAMSAAEVRAAAGLSGPPPAAAAPAPAPALPAGQNSRPPIRVGDVTPSGYRFDNPPTMTFAVTEFDAAPAAPTVDEAKRTITGLALPYNAVAQKYGIKYRFRPGSLEYDASNVSRLVHMKDHMTPVGNHLKVEDTAAGPVVTLSVLDGPEGSSAKAERDLLLYDAQHGLYSGLSVGVDFSLDPESGDVEYVPDEDIYDVLRATWRETTSTPMPAFDDARVTKVAASRSGGNTVDPCQHCGHRHATGMSCRTYAAQVSNLPAPTPPTPESPAPAAAQGVMAPAMAQQFAAFTAFLEQQQAAAPAPNPAGPTLVNLSNAPAQVTEPLPYRFDRHGNLRRGSHDFSTDLFQGWKKGDLAARDRAESFVEAQFAVTPANVTALNYPANKPELYVDQMEYKYPVWDSVNKGTLDEVTPFVVPKFNTATGLVADHVTGTEPTPGAFTATSQTITPSPVSGKVEVTREAFDQGGNPQMSGLIWRQMVRGWYEALEAFVVAQLAANAASIPDLTITTAAADSVLDQALTDAMVPLQFIRGGDRFRRVFTQIDLYKAMVKAKDSNGRRLYPSLGAQNAVGTTQDGYATIDAHGKLWIPAWATAASGTVAASSWMFDPEKVCAWASAPKKIELEWRVAWVDIGLFGYKAFAITDFNGTREVVYDPI